MEIAKLMGVATLCGVVMVWTVVACGSPAADNRASEPEPRGTVTVGQPDEPRVTEMLPETATQPGKPTERETATPGTPTPAPTTAMMANAVVVTPNGPMSTSASDGQVYVAPGQVPTDTPVPTPSPTWGPGTKPNTIWDQFPKQDYEALLPDPNLGVSWGQPFDKKFNHEQETTPEGLTRQRKVSIDSTVMMGNLLADKMADGVTDVEPLGNWRVYRSSLQAKRAAAQWEWVHPEIPITRMIIEAELWATGSATDPKLVVWRAGAYFIMKDTYTQAGQVWRTDYDPEIIGPVIVEQTTCDGMLMPELRHPTLGARCSQ